MISDLAELKQIGHFSDFVVLKKINAMSEIFGRKQLN